MRDLIKNVIESKYGVVRQTRHRIALKTLEESVINSYEYRSGYVEAGSLTTFAVSIEQLQAEGYLVPRSKSEKYKNTAVDSVYWLAESATSYEGWSESSMLRISDVKQLRLDYYRTHPQEQTMETWGYIERVYDFLRTAENREIVTREERSLELFNREKWLSESEGIQLLSRLGLTLDSIKAVVVRELFEYHIQNPWPVRCILISENHSFFDSAKRLMQNGKQICSIKPDMLIYGEGWKIVSSLLFLGELNINPLEVEIHYVGDMDKAGWDIYGKLKLSYPELNLKLALSIYKLMMELTKQSYNYAKEQRACDPTHLELVFQEISADPELKVFIEGLLESNQRVPQEVLNYEVMARLAQG
ncbi:MULTISPECIES: hypothetical protein [Paenibacillus]|uniref:hypothetical protein n=1 Tax=Paenibacillus TaxID=44249 RepID=UPI0011813DCD|nr:hypothetical protein [Paenibacillus borealis]